MHNSLTAVARWTFIVPVLLIAGLALAACGNDDGGGGGGGGTATDEQYVRQLCNATNDFLDELFSGDLLMLMFQAEDNPDAEEELVETATEVFGNFADSLRRMSAPPDVRPHHDRIVEQMDSLVAQLRAGNLDALEEFDEDIDFPQDIQTRLTAAAEDVEECADMTPF